MTGTVAEIVPAADPASHSFLVKIDLPASGQIRSGMYGTAEFPTGTHQAILVPRSAVVVRGSLPSAYVLDSNGIAQLRSITLGAAQGSLIEVLSASPPATNWWTIPRTVTCQGRRSRPSNEGRAHAP